MSKVLVSLSAMTEVSDTPPRRSNLRTALVLLSIAAVFFFGVIVNHWLVK